MRPLLAVALLMGCQTPDEASPPQGGEGVDVPTLCDPVAEPCTQDCPPGPEAIDHDPWSRWLTASPALSWEASPDAAHYELAVGSSPGLDDIACWTDVGTRSSHTLQALWGVEDGQILYPTLRAIDAAGHSSQAVSSEGWTVDILPPDVPTDVVDDAAPVSGQVTWAHPGTDGLSGFGGYEIAIGSAPGLDDALTWTDVGTERATRLEPNLPAEAWYWVSVRAFDVAGNRSQPATSPGFIVCPADFAFVPGREALSSSPFCIARYEMRILGDDNGDQPFDAAFLAESRASGTPWVNLDKGQARVACDTLGFAYQLITNLQWQTIARSIENAPENWSGGAVGAGLVSRGHSDESPYALLSSDGDPCYGTDNPSCEDPSHADWGQKRTHQLQNGEVLWDLAGNAWEQVDSSTGAPAGLWMEFTDAAFTSNDGWEDYRAAFGPEGPYDGSHGMGGIYGGTGNLIRGGSFDYPTPGTAGAQGLEDVGIYAGHHNAWSAEATHGFRCAYTPM
jgi:hypothetical protein